MIPSVGSDKHLGNSISTDIADINSVDSVLGIRHNLTSIAVVTC